MRRLSIFLFCVGFLAIATFPCDASQRYLKFDEIIERADVIFYGKVSSQITRYGTKGKMIFTDVYFEMLELIYKSEQSQPITGSTIMLTFAGGTIGETTVRIPDVPTFETDSSYLICTLMDGRTYDSPIIGGFQGLFKVITDKEHGDQYPLTRGRRGISEIRGGDILAGPPVFRINGGVVEKLLEKETGVKFYDQAPKPTKEMDHQKVRASVSHRKKEKPEKPMMIDELITAIHQIKKGKGGDK